MFHLVPSIFPYHRCYARFDRNEKRFGKNKNRKTATKDSFERNKERKTAIKESIDRNKRTH